MFDVKKIIKEANAEIAKERADKAKRLIKDKVRELEAAERVVRNLKDELAELEEDIANRV